MNFALLSHNLEDFKLNQELILKSDIIWSDGNNEIRYFDEIEYDKGVVLYADDYLTWSSFEYFLNTRQNFNYILVDIRNDKNVDEFIKKYKLDYDYIIIKFFVNLYKPRKRKIEESVILKFNEFDK